MKLISKVDYGVVRNLRVERGQPVFNPAPQVIRSVKFGPTDGRDVKPSSPKLHKGQMAGLFRAIADIGDGYIESLEIQSGLPFRLSAPFNCQT